MIENRKFIRLRAPLPVEYSLIKKHKKQRAFSSCIKNISIGGLSLIVKEPVRVGELIRIQIQVPYLEDAVCVVGDVVWASATKDKHNPAREAGVRFQNVDPSDLNKILDYVYSVAIG